MKYFYNINILDMGDYYTYEIIEDANEYVKPQILVVGGKFYSYDEALCNAKQALDIRGIDTHKYPNNF